MGTINPTNTQQVVPVNLNNQQVSANSTLQAVNKALIPPLPKKNISQDEYRTTKLIKNENLAQGVSIGSIAGAIVGVVIMAVKFIMKKPEPVKGLVNSTLLGAIAGGVIGLISGQNQAKRYLLASSAQEAYSQQMQPAQAVSSEAPKEQLPAKV